MSAAKEEVGPDITSLRWGWAQGPCTMRLFQNGNELCGRDRGRQRKAVNSKCGSNQVPGTPLGDGVGLLLRTFQIFVGEGIRLFQQTPPSTHLVSKDI